MVKTINLKEINNVSVDVEITDTMTKDDIQYAAEMAIQSGNGVYGNTEYTIDGPVDIHGIDYIDKCTYYMIRAAIQLLFYKVDTPTIVGYIYDLYEEYLISDSQEEALYILADPDEEYNTPSEYWNNMDISSDDNPLYQIAMGKKEVRILDKEAA